MKQLDAADADRAERVAVVRLLQVYEQRARLAALHRVLERHLECHLNGRSTVAGIEHLVHLRHRLEQRFCEFDARRVCRAKKRCMVELVELGADGSIDLRGTVAKGGDPEARHTVEIATAVDVDEPRSVGAFHNGRLIGEPEAVLCERVPHRCGIAGEPLRAELHGFSLPRTTPTKRLVGYDHV
jgi:hypothetical protein